MNKGFDLKGNNKLVVDGKFGEASQSCASSHNMSARQTHNCITAINWLRKHYMTHTDLQNYQLQVSGMHISQRA